MAYCTGSVGWFYLLEENSYSTYLKNSIVPQLGDTRIAKTASRISSQLYWLKMYEEIKHFVQHCQVCHQAKLENLQPAGLLQPLPIPNKVWEDISMDFITGLPQSHVYTVIMVVVDLLTKFAHFCWNTHVCVCKCER